MVTTVMLASVAVRSLMLKTFAKNPRLLLAIDQVSKLNPSPAVSNILA